jgi:hypothetical protein
MAKKPATKKAAKPSTEDGGATDRFTLLHPAIKKTAQPIPADGSQAEQDGVAQLERFLAEHRPKEPDEGYLTAGLDDLPQAIEELGREATIALHRLLQRALGKTGNPFQAAARFQQVTAQVDAAVEYHRRASGGRSYGQTATAADWPARFQEEVDACCKKHGGHEDLGAELDRLHKLVEDVQVSKVVEPHGAGIAEAVKSVERTKARLLAKLQETREEYAPTAADQTTLTWDAGAQELGALLNLLVKHGLLLKPKGSMAALARAAEDVFLKPGGIRMDLQQAVRNTARRSEGRITDLEDDIPKKG